MKGLLAWTPVLIDWNRHTQLFILLKYKYTNEYIHPIEAELQAIERIQDIMDVHKANGILKSDREYYYLKIAIMEQIDKGAVIERSCEFGSIILN